MSFEGVIFSRPGETGLIPYMGALWAAEDIGCIVNANVWICPSTTSVIAAMKMLGYTCIDIMAFFYRFPQLASAPIPFRNPLNLGSTLDAIKDDLSIKIINKLGNIPTLDELYTRLGVVFVGIGFNFNQQEVEYIHRETYPNMSILDVICISLSTPGIFRPYKIGNDLWMDGSIIEPFSPSSIVLEQGKMLAITTKQTKITFESKDPINQVKDVMRCVFESLRQISVPDNMTLVKVDPVIGEPFLQLQKGRIAFTEAIPKETERIYPGEAELQS